MPSKVKSYNVSFNVAGRKSSKVKKILAELGAEQIKVQAKPFSHIALPKGEGEEARARAVLLQNAAQGELSLIETRVLGLLSATETVSFHTLTKVIGSTTDVSRALKRLVSLGLVEKVKLGVYRRISAELLVEGLGAAGRNAKKIRESVTRAVEEAEAAAREAWEKLSSRDARLLSSIPSEGPSFAAEACALAGIKTSRSSFVERLRLKGLVTTFGPPRTQQVELTEAGREHPQYDPKTKKARVDFGIDRHPEMALDALVIMGALEEAVAVEVNAVYKRLRPEDPAGAVKMAYLEKQAWVRQVKQPGSARPIYQLTAVGAELVHRVAEASDLPSAYGIRRLLQGVLDEQATELPPPAATASSARPAMR